MQPDKFNQEYGQIFIYLDSSKSYSVCVLGFIRTSGYALTNTIFGYFFGLMLFLRPSWIKMFKEGGDIGLFITLVPKVL